MNHVMRFTVLLMVLSLSGCMHKELRVYKDIEVYKDIVYYEGPDSTQKHRLDLYLPDTANFPVLIFIHGGGWRQGDKSTYAYLGEAFSQQGIGTVVISYRLSPEVKHPEHIKDVARAFSWVYQNIEKYGGRKDQIFLAGHSAGAHLAALLALDGEYLEEHGIPTSAVSGVICMSGVYDIRDMARNEWGKEIVESAFGDNADVWREASPITYTEGYAPPFLVVVAENDPLLLREEGKAFADARGVELLQSEGRNHFTIIARIGTEGDATTEEILAFIAATLS